MTEPNELSSFEGKVGVIPGGSQGLGYAVAALMAQRGAAGLVIAGRDADKGSAAAAGLSTAHDCDVRFVAADLNDRDAPAAIMGTADDAFGRVDALCTTAATTFRGSVWDTTAEMWDQMLAVNTRAPAVLITEAAKIMKREGIAGSIVNIGSVAAHAGQDFLYAYSASKIALRAITKSAAHSLMRHRIRVNLVQPGWMNTPAEHVVQKTFHGADDNWLEAAAASRPFGRLIDPAELARTICFLASDEAGMLTGAVFDYDQTVAGAGDPAVPSLTPIWGEDDES